MAALRRGIARYADGTDNVVPKPVKTVPVSVPPDQQVPDYSSFSTAAPEPSALSFSGGAPAPAPVPVPAPVPQSFRELLGNAIGMRGPEARTAAFSGGQPPVPVERSPLNTLWDMYTGQYGNVSADPRASAFSHYLAGSAEAAVNQGRAQNLANGPSNVQKLVTGLFGTQGEWDSLKAHDVAANVLSHPSVQQHLINHPDQLAEAEQNRLAYSQKVQAPEFIQHMKDAQTFLTNLMTNGANHPADVNGPEINVPPHQINDPAAAAKIKATVPGMTDIHGVAATQPHTFTREEFGRIFEGVPLRDLATLFGPLINHIQSPQEQVQRAYFGSMQAKYDKLVAQRQQLLGVNPKADVRAHDAAIDAQLAEMMKATKSFGEITTKRPSFPVD